MSFSDADPISNQRLQEYESLQFLNPDRNSPVAIEKTQTHGDLYDAVLFGDQSVDFPKPFLFALSPLDAHPNFVAADRLARVLCVYDNAGESFLPGGDTATSPVTRHLALSQVLMFLFDPTQDVQFREACAGKTNDPQMKQRSERLDRERSVRQETILLEAAQRVRRYSGVAENTKHHRPLIVVVTKYDAWAPLINSQKLDSPWTNPSKAGICALDRTQIENVSKAVRELLWDLTPELVSAAEQFAEQVIYVPVSATGRSPELDKQTGEYGIRPRDIAPIWAEVPLLYALSRWMEGVIPYRNPNTAGNAEHAPLAKAPGSSMAKTGISSQAPPPMPVNGLSSSKQNNANGRSAHGRGEATLSQELIYTSAPQGLKPGSHGFCTVVSTKGMAANLAGKLEALSAFRHVYAPQEDQPDLNPVVWSHLKLVVGGWSCHVLSRIASAGFDYSKRSNKLAHHVVLDQVELVPAGPAAVLSAHEFMLTSWDGRTGVLPAGRRPPHMECVPAICEAWKAVTGDAGWGGALAEAALAPGNRPATIIFRPGIELLPLFYEALALLPPERRWQVSFSTYFTKLPPGIECQWRGVLAGSPEAHAVRRVPNSLIIDLSRPLGRADESRLVEAGRTGILRVVGRPPMVSGGLRGTLNDQNASETANDDYGELLRLIDQPSEHVTPSFGVKQTTSDVSEIDIGPPPRNALVPTSSTHTEDPSCQQRSSWAIPAGVLVTAIFLISIATAAYYCAAHFGFSSFATAVKTDIRPEENAQRDFSPARDQGETSVADLKIRPDVDIEVSDNKQEGLSPERKDQSHPEQTDDSASHKPTNDAASLTGIINKADGGKNEPLIQQDSKLSRETPPTVIEVPPENPFASFAPNEYYVLPIPEFQVPGGFQKHGQTTASIQFSHIPSPQSIEVDLIGTKHIEPPIACHFKWEEAENAWTLIAEDGKDGARAIASLKPFENNLTFVWKAVKGNQEQLNQLCNLILKFTDRRYPEYTCVLRLRKPELVEPLRFDAMGLPSMKSERTISVRRPLRAAPAVAFGEVTGLPDGTRKATNAATYDFTTHNDEMSQSFIAKLQFQGKKSWIDAVELTLEYKGVIGPLNNLHKKVKVLSTVPINTAKVNKITKELQGDAKGYSEKRASASLALANAEAARLLDNVASLKADINNLDRDLTWISKCQEELGKLGNVVTQLEDENTLIHYRGFYQIDGYEVIIFQSDASIKKSPKKSQLPRK